MNRPIKLNEADQYQGNKNASIVLLEYGDYECPHCGAAYPIIKKLQRHFDKELLFVFRNFPLAEMHPYAYEAACAAEAVGIQGKFWPMHDLIFENQQTLSSRQLLNLGRVISADIDQMIIDMKSEFIRNKVEYDLESGIRNGVNGTPTFFVNGTRFDGYHDFESMKHAMNEFLV